VHGEWNNNRSIHLPHWLVEKCSTSWYIGYFSSGVGVLFLRQCWTRSDSMHQLCTALLTWSQEHYSSTNPSPTWDIWLLVILKDTVLVDQALSKFISLFSTVLMTPAKKKRVKLNFFLCYLSMLISIVQWFENNAGQLLKVAHSYGKRTSEHWWENTSPAAV